MRRGTDGLAGKNLLAAEVAAIGEDIDLLDGHGLLCQARHGREQRPVGHDVGDVMGDDQGSSRSAPPPG